MRFTVKGEHVPDGWGGGCGGGLGGVWWLPAGSNILSSFNIFALNIDCGY